MSNAESDIPKQLFSFYEFLVMTFELRNAAQSFQWFMDDVLGRLDFCVSYIDDILISSGILEQHEQHLGILFGRLNSRGPVIDVAKCILGVNDVEFKE